MFGLVDNFRTFVEYLTLVIAEGGQLTDDAYKKYLTECEKVQKIWKNGITTRETWT